MTAANVRPEKITKPIQLLASWLLGLIIIDGIFVSAALKIDPPNWTHYLFCVAAVVNVPLFLFSLFVLQTKFRPEMQDDEYYSGYIKTKMGLLPFKNIENTSVPDVRLDAPLIEPPVDMQVKFNNKWTVAINDLHPQFFDIIKKLKEFGITVAATYGSKNTKKIVPAKWVISIDRDIDDQSLKTLLKSLVGFKFDGFKLENIDQYDEYHIFIGSYGNLDGCFELSDEVIENIEIMRK